YLPLETSLNQIRYIAVDPGHHEEPVSCFLGYTNLRRRRKRKRIHYEAVSYCWGEVSDTVEISLRCARRKVTRNLETLLRAFRRPGKHRVLWIDAICINQGDNLEKTHQVGSMGSIYKSASRVLVWLGEADLFSDIMVESYKVFETKLSSRPLVTCAERLFLRDWFHRIWVLQEIVLA
ncbi:HET-domain-containing protein, partial [Setomelanomma holmii]